MNNFPAMTAAQRQEMVNWLEEGIACRDEYGFSGNVLKSMQIALAALTSPPAPVLRLPDGWIKCSERMPESDDLRCMVYCRDSVIRTAFTSHGDWAMNGKYYDRGYVTHWMPLPSPPEASNEQ